MKIKREKWGKRYVVTLREEGHLISYRRWSPAKFNLSKAARTAKEWNTLHEGRLRKAWTNIKGEYIQEFRDTSRYKGARKDDERQYFYSVRIGKKEIITRSRKLKGVSARKLKEEADKNFFRALMQTFNASYDEVKDKILPDMRKRGMLKKGVIYYRKR